MSCESEDACFEKSSGTQAANEKLPPCLPVYPSDTSCALLFCCMQEAREFLQPQQRIYWERFVKRLAPVRADGVGRGHPQGRGLPHHSVAARRPVDVRCASPPCTEGACHNKRSRHGVRLARGLPH